MSALADGAWRRTKGQHPARRSPSAVAGPQLPPSNIVMLGPFGLRPRMTMQARALPLAQALVKRGHHLTMLLPPWQNPTDAGKSWEEAGVAIENMTLPAGVPGWFHMRLTAALVRRARALQPDIVHIFKPKAYAGLAHLALQTYPIVLDTDDWEGPGGWNDLNPYPPLLKRLFTWQERWGLRHAHAITVASRSLQTLAWATGGPAERVFYIPNGVAWPHPSVTPLAHPRPTLLLYTRFFEFNLPRLWRIVQGVRAQRPATRLYFIGKGFFEEEAQLRTLAQTAGWRIADIDVDAPPAQLPDADLIYGAGWVAPETQAAHFAHADVAVYPFEDNLLNRTKCPAKLMDLLAAGVPVVADAVGQIAQAIQPGETGMLIPPGDDDAYIAAIIALLDDKQRRQTMRIRAAQDVRSRFSWDKLAHIAESAYAYAVQATATTSQ